MHALLVVLQFAFATVLALTSNVGSIAFLVFATAGALLLIWALKTVGPRNVKVSPAVADKAELITTGAFGWVRHPMYTALAVATIGFVVSDAELWRVAVGLGLVGVLVAKARVEERLLCERFPGYDAYRRTTGMFFPKILSSAPAQEEPREPS